MTLGKIRLLIRPSFALYMLILWLFSSYQTCVGLVCALFAHEAGHLLICRLLSERIERVEISPFGGIMTYQTGYSPSKGWKGIAIAIAGPLANYGCILVSSVIVQDRVLGQSLVQANLSMLFINLLPVFPLDGGAAVFSVGYYLFPVGALIRWLCMLGVFTGIALIAFGLYGYVYHGILNLTLPLIGAYLSVCALKSRNSMLVQNLFTVIHERFSQSTEAARIHAYQIDDSTPLLSLIQLIGRSKSVLFAVIHQDDSLNWLTDKAVCKALLRDPELHAGELLARYESITEKE